MEPVATKAELPRNDSHSNQFGVIQFALLSLAYAFLFFVCIALIEGGPLFALTALGLFFATVILNAAWVALGPERLGLRLIKTFASLVIVGLGGALGLYTTVNRWGAISSEEKSMLVTSLTFLASFWIAAQIPFWFMRQFVGWRLFGTPRLATHRLSIADVMIATAIAAVSVAPINAINISSELRPIGWFWILLIYMIMMAVNSIVFGLPVVYLVTRGSATTSSEKKGNLTSRDTKTIRKTRRDSVVENDDSIAGCGFVMFYFLVISFLLLLLLAAVVPSEAIAEVGGYVFVLIGSLVFFVAVPLAIGVQNGLRLVNVKKENRAAALDPDKAQKNPATE